MVLNRLTMRKINEPKTRVTPRALDQAFAGIPRY